MSSPQEYWQAIPPLTRGYLALLFGTTALSSLKMINPAKLAFFPTRIINNFEVWRIFTNFFFIGPFSFQFVMQLLIVSRFGSGYENDPFPTSEHRGSVDFLFAVLCMGGAMLPIAYFMEMPLLGPSLMYSLIYLWSKRNPEAPVSVWGFALKGKMVPWAFLAFTVLMGNSPVNDVVGLVAAHLFYFLAEVMPLKTGQEYLKTPNFVASMANYIATIGAPAGGMPVGTSTAAPRAGNPWEQSAPAASTAGASSSSTGGYTWGSGNKLGGS